MNLLRLMTPESLAALRAVRGTAAFQTARMDAWQSHKSIPGFPGWELFKRLLDAAIR